jgi:hypothetical protein
MTKKLVLHRTLLTAVVLIAGCTPGKLGSGPMDLHAFAEVYVDVTASVWAAKRTTSDTTVLAHVADSVIATHAITIGQYRKTFAWYNADVERWRGFYDEATKIFEERSRREAEKAAEARAPGNPSAR